MPIMTAATVTLVSGSMTIRLPVTRLSRYWSAAMGSASRQRTTPMSLAPSSRAGTRRSVFRFSLLSIPTTSQIGRATCCSSDLLVGGDGFGQPPTYHPDVIGPELPGRHQAECLQVQLALDPNHLTPGHPGGVLDDERLADFEAALGEIGRASPSERHKNT